MIPSLDPLDKKGMAQDRDQVIYHTGPHHDDLTSHPE